MSTHRHPSVLQLGLCIRLSLSACYGPFFYRGVDPLIVARTALVANSYRSGCSANCGVWFELFRFENGCQMPTGGRGDSWTCAIARSELTKVSRSIVDSAAGSCKISHNPLSSKYRQWEDGIDLIAPLGQISRVQYNSVRLAAITGVVGVAIPLVRILTWSTSPIVHTGTYVAPSSLSISPTEDMGRDYSHPS
ncbi:hypothetical protein BDM02DRAFT_1466658 [Thelephora ganbajun]|uniref:Uncharacterized protein n=1 Tax=Thelephora ganbajun TaxID=370292 RepID=A0ACB6Z1S5_THEGA|nr:hypothetical protein BDM02DRAFT_1466658 [Thelephora ganbajun]